MGGNLRNMAILGTKHSVRYLRHVCYLGYVLLEGFTVLLLTPPYPLQLSTEQYFEKACLDCNVYMSNSTLKTNNGEASTAVNNRKKHFSAVLLDKIGNGS